MEAPGMLVRERRSTAEKLLIVEQAFDGDGLCPFQKMKIFGSVKPLMWIIL